MKIEKENH